MVEKYVEALESYEIQIKSVRKGRGAWICDTGEGLRTIYEYKGTKKRMEFEYKATELLKAAGIRTEQIIRNKDDALITKTDDQTSFVMKEHIGDRECNLKDSTEVVKAAGQIGILHNIMRTITLRDEWVMGSVVGEKVLERMQRHNRELKKGRAYIRNKKKKTLFETNLIENFDEFYNEAVAAKEGLKASNAEEGFFLCHGELNQHHILFGTHGISFTEFCNMHYGEQAEDIYYFMRKVLEKNNWNIKLGMDMLSEYEKYHMMNSSEKMILYYLFMYPEKYRKQMNYYLNTNKSWVPEKNIEKLKIIREQSEARRSFISQLQWTVREN